MRLRGRISRCFGPFDLGVSPFDLGHWCFEIGESVLGPGSVRDMVERHRSFLRLVLSLI